MRFTLSIDCDNAAFGDEDTGEVDAYSASRELTRLLHHAAARVAAGELANTNGFETLRDVNGNRVGSFGLEDL